MQWLRKLTGNVRTDASLPPGLIVLESDSERVAQWCSWPGGLVDEALWEDLRSYQESFPYCIRLSDRGQPIRCEACGTLVALTPESAHEKAILGARVQWTPGIWEQETLRRHTMRRCEWKRANG